MPKGTALDSMSAAATSSGSAITTPARWHSALYNALRGRAEPALVFPEATVSAASLWVASRLWVDVLRNHGLGAGDRVVIDAPPSPGFLAFLIAAIWEGLSIAIMPPGMRPEQSLAHFDARMGLGCDDVYADNAGCPLIPERWAPRTARLAPTPDARLFMRTCGTCGNPGWVALSDANIWAVLDSHRPHLVRRDDVVLSILPWFHSFGLIIDLLPALLGAGIIVREPSGGKDATSILSTAAAFSATWCSMVPLQTQRLAASTEGLEFLRGLRGGVIGGASASQPLAEAISGTHLFVGYGQTEASPGVTLGQPGHWVPGAIGQAVGCELRVRDDGHLHVRGPNVCMGRWTPEGLSVLEPDRWLDTGDLVTERGDELIFLGRVDHNFKLANGRMIDAAQLESSLRTLDPRIIDCAVISADSFSLRVYAVMREPQGKVDSRTIARVFGSLAERVEAIITLPETTDMRTAKGALDRRRLLQAHAMSAPSPTCTI